MKKILPVLFVCWFPCSGWTAQGPKMLAYSARPNPYFNEHADEVSEIYDGLFFTIGSWDAGVENNLGADLGNLLETPWKKEVEQNLKNLREAGVTENLLGVSFGGSEPWPSPETLLSETYTQKMTDRFAVLGRAARDLGFRGVSIDVEYPYPRYELDHGIYTYEGYTPGELLRAAENQGKKALGGLLDEFPQAVVFVLPGMMWSRPLERAFVLGMFGSMAERGSPGGLHFGFERSYSLYEFPLTHVAIPRVADLAAEVLLQDELLDYWKEKCTVAPGVWPTHRVETGGKDYPRHPWEQELKDLRRQMQILRSVAKRYVWSYSGQPLWYNPKPELEKEYGLQKPNWPDAEELLSGWYGILRDKSDPDDPRIQNLINEVRRFDNGEFDGLELCRRFGTPGEWMVLAPLGNPYTKAAFSAPEGVHVIPKPESVFFGRDGAVRWFRFPSRNPLGSVSLLAALDWLNTDDCSAHLFTFLCAEKDLTAVMRVGWDDGIIIRMDDEVIFDERTYPERGHGMIFRDRYLFEKSVDVRIGRGKHRLVVTSINSHGLWGFNLRFTDNEGYPVEGMSFSLPVRH